jgi:hypothetical protein
VTAHFSDKYGKSAQGAVRVVINPASGPYKPAARMAGDNQNVKGAWPERGTLTIQLGANKNGRKG